MLMHFRRTDDACSNDAVVGNATEPSDRAANVATEETVLRLLIVAGFCALYWLTSDILPVLWKGSSFGADSNLYFGLSIGQPDNHTLHYHVFTVALATAWMELFEPIVALGSALQPAEWLKGLFALVGALGLLAAFSAFSAAVGTRNAILWSLVYGLSFSIWYFASIPESKIINGTLSSAYIAAYIHFRNDWTQSRLLALTAIFAAACFNEIVAIFLVAVPIVDIVIRDGFALRNFRWVFLQALLAPAILGFADLGIGRAVTDGSSQVFEGNHFQLFLTYVALTDHSLSSLYGCVLQWFFFSLAAPTPYATGTAALWPQYYGYFEISFLNYFTHPAGVFFIAILGLISVCGILASRKKLPAASLGLVAGLFVYTLVRAFFFFLFDPDEALLYTPSVVLAHLVILAIPFAASSFRFKASAVTALAISVFILNLRFMMP